MVDSSSGSFLHGSESPVGDLVITQAPVDGRVGGAKGEMGGALERERFRGTC